MDKAKLDPGSSASGRTSPNLASANQEHQLDYKRLIKVRGTIKARVTLFKEHLSVLKQIPICELTSMQVRELRCRLEKLQELFSLFDETQTNLEIYSDEQLTERNVTEQQFYALIATAQELIDNTSISSTHKTVNNESVHSLSHKDGHIKLPTIKLPNFDGNYLKWLEYRDTYKSLIHENDSISPINKFHYLRSSLEGSAASAIKSVEFSAANYEVAWSLLCDRFNNDKILINNHLKTLFNIEPMTRESHKGLRYFVDHITKNLRALETLGQPVDQWDVLIIHLMSNKLDSLTFRKWEELGHGETKSSSLKKFISFLRNRANMLETMWANRPDQRQTQSGHKPYNNNNSNVGKAQSLVSSNTNDRPSHLACPYCSNLHRLLYCKKYLALSADKRLSEATKLGLCLNCLRRGHTVADCRSTSCKQCNERHHSLIHTENQNNESNNNIESNNLPVSLSAQSAGQVLLGTALIKVINPDTNNTYLARALLDSGSQSSFITAGLKNKLGLITNKSRSILITGINNAQIPITDTCDITMKSLMSEFQTDINCLVLPEITGKLPSMPIDISKLNLPPNIKLADPQFHRPADIDMLLGAEIFYNVLSSDQIKLGVGNPILQSSKLGWLVTGSINNPHNSSARKIHCNFTREISEQLVKFWEIEELPFSKPALSVDEEFCEKHFLENTKRLDDGRFSVLMPIRSQPEEKLGDSYKLAKGRFLNLEKRFKINTEFKQQYLNFIREYGELGHLTKIDKPSFGFFLPHHAVIRESSETSRLRVVFDASAKTTSNLSLNDIQCVGPVVQDELFDILIRFRQHNYVLTGDISKMYRRISIHESQRNLQLILWRDDEHLPLDVLQLNTVTYGTASAPFLATRCLYQLSLECQDPTIAEIIKKDFYFDDMLTGASSRSALRHIAQAITDVLGSACLPVHKFRSNCPTIIQNSSEAEVLDLSKESSVLGVLWAPVTDSLRFNINLCVNKKNITKRNILSDTCRIFDPLGLLSPYTISLKILLQTLWKLKLDWDQPVPANIIKTWNSLTCDVNKLHSISIPRQALYSYVHDNTELHVFVDASQDAYAACIYLRCIGHEGTYVTQLLCAKTRVAPLKSVTIPRLELCAALLGSRLAARVSAAIRCSIAKKVYWSDSTITLGWIKTQPKLLKAFICNRVNEIRDLTNKNDWRHIPTELNPADLGSRGVDPNTLVNSQLWWQGPCFLKEPESEWPSTPNTIEQLPELKTALIENSYENPLVVFENYSSSNKLKRIIAYVLRFANNCRSKTVKYTNSLSVSELDNSLILLLKLSQRESFLDVLQTMNKGKTDKLNAYILNLSPFIENNTGLLRVGGRLENAPCSYEKRHPALLDAKHHFTKLLMLEEHLHLFHAGPQLLLSSFREKFWPIGGRTLARATVRNCIICTKLRAKSVTPFMGNLPMNRVTQAYPFQVCGTDFAGPFLISAKLGRGNRISKCYLCVFVCFATKALHLETVSDLSTPAFIACLKRFISRRGKPSIIHCDNAKNFVGASNELGKLLRSSLRSIRDFSASEGIQFVFSPPYSPTFGGLWEAGVKSAKHHIKRIAGNVSLTYEELNTLFTQIEAILNSRPLTPMSSDPQDLSPLTPGHFLIGRPITALPTPPVTESRRLLSRHERLETLRRHFWQRWSTEYICELQARAKWRTQSPTIRVGDLVVFKDNNLPPLLWKLGRVQEIYPGPDGIVRVADFKTTRGIERRAINRVCPLPVEPNTAVDGNSSTTN